MTSAAAPSFLYHNNVTKLKYSFQIHTRMLAEGYNPRTWRTNPLHMLPPEAEEFSWDDPRTTASLDWIFLISSLNFSFWSDKDVSERYGVQLREFQTSGDKDGEKVELFTGYCSLVAAINRGLFSIRKRFLE
jgi:hypothetical protein